MAHSFASLIALDPAALEPLLAAGTAPRFSDLVGFEFRGWNVFGDPVAAGVGAVLGIRRFAKGFFARNGVSPDEAPTIEGYNCKIARGGPTDPWTDKGETGPVRHGFFRVFRAGEGDERFGRHANALLLDYSRGDPRPGLLDGAGLRDFLVHPEPGNRDLLLGKAYMHVGPLRTTAGFFVAERLRASSYTPPR